MTKTILTTILTIAGLALAVVVVAVLAAPTPPCSLPQGIERALAQSEQIALPGLDAQLHKCVRIELGAAPYAPSGHPGWDGYLAGDPSALSNLEKAGALLFFGGGAGPVGPGVDFEEIYRQHTAVTTGAIDRSAASRDPPTETG
jgi:hypothetical protein